MNYGKASTAHDSTAAIAIGGKSEMLFAQPLAAYDSPHATAYTARRRSTANADLMALLCRGIYPPRMDILNPLRRLDNAALLRLLDHGLVMHPQDGQHYHAFVFEQPLNLKLWPNLDQVRQPLTEDFINRRFIAPINAALHELDDMGIMHGGIRPTNIFWRESSGGVPQLGESITTESGITQPALFETLQRAQSQPFARGSGTIADDMYALGVTIIMLLMGKNPLKGIEDKIILRSRLERGSFITMVEGFKPAPSHVELLRGLLHDDPLQRWTPHDVEQWLGGQRSQPKPSTAIARATRGLKFMDKDYTQIRPLLPALWENVGEAAKLLQNGEVDRWLRRSLSDTERADALQQALENLNNGSRGSYYEDQMVTIASIVLDPHSPIAYRGLVLMPDGIAGAAAEALRTGEGQQIIAEIINYKFISGWADRQHNRADYVTLTQNCERVQRYLGNPALGYGFERLCYELNPHFPCLSQLLIGRTILSAKEWLPVMETLAQQGKMGREPLDRHMAAWLASKDRNVQETLRGISDDALRRHMVGLSVYYQWQEKYGPQELPHLTSWFGTLLQSLGRRYYSRTTREAVVKAMAKVAEGGKLSDVVRLFNDQKVIQHDHQGLRAARQVYQATLAEIAVLERQMKHRHDVEQVYGRPTATYIAWVIGAMMSAYTIMRTVAGG